MCALIAAIFSQRVRGVNTLRWERGFVAVDFGATSDDDVLSGALWSAVLSLPLTAVESAVFVKNWSGSTTALPSPRRLE
jgi:hypothetical protein